MGSIIVLISLLLFEFNQLDEFTFIILAVIGNLIVGFCILFLLIDWLYYSNAYILKFTEYWVTNKKIIWIYNGTLLVSFSILTINLTDISNYMEWTKDNVEHLTLKYFNFYSENIKWYDIKNGRLNLTNLKYRPCINFENWKELEIILKKYHVKKE